MFGIRFNIFYRISASLSLHYQNTFYKMEPSGANNISENAISNIQNAENIIKPKQQSTEKEKLVRELTDMGFSKSLVLQVIYFKIGYLYSNSYF